MKIFFAIIAFLSLSACKSTQNTKKDNQKTLNFKEITVENGCLENSVCSIEVMHNKGIAFQTENTTGMLQPKFQPDSTSNVVRFIVKKNTDKRMTDAQYREEVIFEVPKMKSTLNLKDRDLSKVHFTYGRFCFCNRDSVGYFKVKKGKLILENGKFSFQFENGQVPQKLGKITGTYH